MFDKLFKFGVKREPIEAFGFFLAYFFLNILLCGILSATLGLIFGGDVYALHKIQLTQHIINLLMGIILSFTIIIAKQLLGSFKAIFVGILAIFLSFKFDLFIGLIAITYLTTFANKSTKKS